MPHEIRQATVDALFEDIIAAADFEVSGVLLGLEQHCQSQYPTVAIVIPVQGEG